MSDLHHQLNQLSLDFGDAAPHIASTLSSPIPQHDNDLAGTTIPTRATQTPENQHRSEGWSPASRSVSLFRNGSGNSRFGRYTHHPRSFDSFAINGGSGGSVPATPDRRFHNWFARHRAASSGSSSHHHSPASHSSGIDLTYDDRLYWILEACVNKTRNHDIQDVISRNGPRYIINAVPHTIRDIQVLSGLRMTCFVNRVIHGTWYGRKAVFVGLTVTHTGRRAQSTKVKIDVSLGGLAGVDHEECVRDLAAHQPIIAKYAPRVYYGLSNRVEQGQEVGMEGNIAGPAVITASGLRASVNRTTSTVIDRRQEIHGWTESEPRMSTKTTFQLTAIENAVTKDGIYPSLPIGLIIETRDKPLVITADIESKQPVFNATFNYVTGSFKYNMPVYIDELDWIGDGLPPGLEREMGNWDDDMWRSLVNYSEETESILVGG